MYKAEIRDISARLKPIREKLKVAKATLVSVPKVQQLLEIERDMENKIIHKERNKTR